MSHFIDKQCSKIYLYLSTLRDTSLSQTQVCQCEHVSQSPLQCRNHLGTALGLSQAVTESNGLNSSCSTALEEKKLISSFHHLHVDLCICLSMWMSSTPAVLLFPGGQRLLSVIFLLGCKLGPTIEMVFILSHRQTKKHSTQDSRYVSQTHFYTHFKQKQFPAVIPLYVLGKSLI